MPSAIEAVTDAFRAEAGGSTLRSGVLATHVETGGFHVKSAGLLVGRAYYAAKVNANFPTNRRVRGLPTIQGVLALFDAESGEVLALMDSTEITAIRTAAASATAARYLSSDDASSLTIIGCGVQGLYHARSFAAIRQIRTIALVDRDPAAAERLACRLVEELGVDVRTGVEAGREAREAELVITCTSATAPVLNAGDLPRRGFVAAVGADSEHKQELTVEALAASAVVVDVLAQCATIGELHHALKAGLMRETDVRATLADVVAGKATVRPKGDQPIVFDSTGTALEDVACAAVSYERALDADVGVSIDLMS